MKSSLMAAAALMALVFAGPASGAIVSVDPDAFADATDISNAYAGVTLSALGAGSTEVFAKADSIASTGRNVFSSRTYGIEWGDGFNGGMRVDFASATDFVAIDIIGNDPSDSGQLLAYSSLDALIGSYATGNLGDGIVENASISVAGIAWVLATGSANNVDSVSLDNLTYNRSNGRVPEPSTVAIWSLLGALGMVVGWRRRRRSA